MSTKQFDNSHLVKKNNAIYIGCKTDKWNAKCNIPREEYCNHSTYALLKKRCEKYPEENLWGYREQEGKQWSDYKFITSTVGLELVDALGSALIHTLKLKKGDCCGIMTKNRYEWFVAQFAMHRQGIIPIFLYATLGADQVKHIVQLMKLKYLFVGTPYQTGIEICEQNADLNMGLITFDDQKDVKSGIRHFNYNELLNAGRKQIIEPDLPSPDDTFSVIFTSGTSGLPKGVVHTHRSILNACFSFITANIFDLQTYALGMINYSYLPAAHVFDQQIALAFMFGYGCVGFNSGGVTAIVSDLGNLKPTFMIAVPRVLQKIYDKFVDTVNANCLTRTLYNIAYADKRNAVRNGTTTLIPWDAIIFNKIKNMMGGRLGVILNGSAPLTPELYDWLRVCTGAQIFQVYGMTESFGGLCTSAPGLHDDNLTSIGSACLNCEVRLVSVPELDYSIDAEVPAGEIQLRAGQIFKEYYQDPEQTNAAFTEDHFLQTGDIAKINYDGSISIIDRKKNLFKLAQGEYVAVEPLEYTYGLCPLVSQCFIHGESTDTFITGIIVPDMTSYKKFIVDTFKFEGTNEQLQTFANTKEPKEAFRKEIEKFVRSKGVPGYEVVRNIYVELTPFSEENGLLTATMKIRRLPIKKAYADILKKIRAEVL